ncbi:MAG: hypothetical protein JJU00_11730 [Opitutales bacterium]|nr:hypothetical protein [Opitutales bacterium]
METTTPAGWVVGVIFSLALAGVALRSLAKRDLWSRAELALLYTMLAIAVPVMNLGLMRPFFNAGHAVLREYVYQGTSTYRTAYDVLDDRWFPKVPSFEGLAWNKADRLLRLLEDGAEARRQRDARRAVTLALTDELMRRELLERAQEDPEHPDLAALRESVRRLSYDGTQEIRAHGLDDALRELGLLVPLRERADAAAAASQVAAEVLGAEIAAFNEWHASLLPRNLETMDFSARERLMEAMEGLTREERAAKEEAVGQLAGRVDDFRRMVTALSFSDRDRLLEQLRAQEEERLAGLSRAAFDAERNSFVFRMTREERRALIRQDGDLGPNQNLWAVEYSLWSDSQAREARERASWRENMATLVEGIPWGLYLRPLFSWAVLFLALYFFLMCLAEWFRRKWVSRENLTFPLVEIADNIIRHDYRIELGGDGLNPERRTRPFYPLAMMGFAVGFLMLFFEALSHYGFLARDATFFFHFNDDVFVPAGGALREVPTMVFVLSPIIVGIVFLLSLEVGFAIWATFLIYVFVAWVVRIMFPNLQDSGWTGFGDGRFYPWPMEQMLGACIVFAAFMIWKSRGNTAVPKTAQEKAEAYLPPALTRWGLILTPVLILALLWSLGVRSIALLSAFSIVLLAVAIAAARVRAETGLPTTHVFYENTKLPVILGLTGVSGAKNYAAFVNIVFLPMTLLFRTLPQQLENMELARRYRISFRTVAVSGAFSFATAVGVGLVSFMLFAFYLGRDFYGGGDFLPPHAGEPGGVQLATYPLWVSHFLGEPGLDQFDSPNWIRIGAIAVGAAIIGLLLFLRQKFLRFPLHPVGYLLLLLSIHYAWVSPYMGTGETRILQGSTLWGGAFVAWLLKKMIVKYGGMTSYKRAKPFFVGLVVGSVVCVFTWNMIHLVCGIYARRVNEPGAFARTFIEYVPYIPALY